MDMVSKNHYNITLSVIAHMNLFSTTHIIMHAESADKAAMDMRDMEIERRLRAGEDLQDIVVAKKHPKEVIY